MGYFDEKKNKLKLKAEFSKKLDYKMILNYKDVKVKKK